MERGFVPPYQLNPCAAPPSAVPPDFLKAGENRLLFCRRACHAILVSHEHLRGHHRRGARGGPRRFVVAQAADPTILEALDQARKMGFAAPVLVGKRRRSRRPRADAAIDLSGCGSSRRHKGRGSGRGGEAGRARGGGHSREGPPADRGSAAARLGQGERAELGQDRLPRRRVPASPATSGSCSSRTPRSPSRPTSTRRPKSCRTPWTSRTGWGCPRPSWPSSAPSRS